MPDVCTGAGIAQWLERRTRDWKVAGSNPCRSGGRIFVSRVNFLCWLLFRYPFHPRVTAVARKRPRSFRQKCRWQVTTKHAYTLGLWLCMKWHGADIHKSDCPHCQWFDKSLLTFWNCYMIKKQNKNALLSLFLTAYHYSLGVFFPAKDTKAGAIEGCQTWMSLTLSVTECMSSLDIYVSLYVLIVIFLLGLLHLDFNQVLRHEKTVCPVYLPLFHSQYASHGHLLEEWF